VIYLLAFLLATLLSAVLVPVVERLACHLGAIDLPVGGRKIHQTAVVRLGGLCMAVSFIMTVLYTLGVSRQLLGLLAGIAVLVTVGVVDDVRSLSPWHKLFWQVVAACVALAGGIGITSFTNPMGGVISLQAGRTALSLGSFHFHITPIANIFSLLWMVALINAINFLDGLDGLAGGVSGIAAVVMFALAISARVHQPEVALLAVILAGSILGWLPVNMYPARMFMGDSGAYFLGLTLAMLSIYSGAKLATAVLVLGIPLLDMGWAVLRRLYRRRSPFTADRGHLHHLMLDAGLSQRQAVAIFYLVAGVFGATALFTGSYAKLLSMVILLVVMAILTAVLMRAAKRKTTT
jgi:UDP-GlcNAc:undecaprenyl-phosphate/decaprenyl-phosphate GlcNAc-1-phosphate transferase